MTLKTTSVLGRMKRERCVERLFYADVSVSERVKQKSLPKALILSLQKNPFFK